MAESQAASQADVWRARTFEVAPHAFAAIAFAAGALTLVAVATPALPHVELGSGDAATDRFIRRDGVVVDEHVRTPMLGSLVAYRGARIRLAHVGIGAQIAAAAAHRDDPDFPMRLIGMRQPRSENSWMHNSQVLGGRHCAAAAHRRSR